MTSFRSDTQKAGRPLARLTLAAATVAAGIAFAVLQPQGADAKQNLTAKIQQGQLVIEAGKQDDTITLRRSVGGATLQVFEGNGNSVDFEFPMGSFSSIVVSADRGDDIITLDEVNGAIPAATINGGDGDDVLIGGSGNDVIYGDADNDTILGKGGVDSINGGMGNDTLTGGDADDLAFGESGDDRMIWNPGDDTDLNEGGAGSDVVEVNGGNGSEQFTTTANGTRVRFDRLSPAPFAIDIGTSESLALNANGGDDTFAATGNLATLIQITVDGGAGNDTILGSNGPDVLSGGAGNDFVDGQQGADTAVLGENDDVFQWDPGDGNDVVEGQAGQDKLVFNGSAANEIFEASANTGRVRFTRNIANIVMDLDDVESLEINALGGADLTTVNDLSGTHLVDVKVNLGLLDSQPDTVTVNGTNGADIVDVFGGGTSVAVVGLPALVSVTSSEGANDSLIVKGLAGNDGLTAATLPGGIVKLTLDGGADTDTIIGSAGNDILLGGDGADFIDGQQGNDAAFMGDGTDVFQWDPGDGSDVVEGQAGSDTLLFFGSNAGEEIDVSANGGRILFLRNVGGVTMDLDDVETIDFRALGNTDKIAVGDLSGTDITQFNVDLQGSAGGGDAAADNITVNGTNGNDTITVTGAGTSASVTGLQATVNITNAEIANDRLTVNGQGGADTIDANGLGAGVIALTLNGGLGNDIVLGSAGDDAVNGGDGNDVAFLGAGDDSFTWNPGDDNDTIEGQAGFDTMVFNGANVTEEIVISANGARALFTRNIANVAMDLNDLEEITFAALGGADLLTVNATNGTDLVRVNFVLSVPGGAGDAATDTIVVNGTNGDDVIMLAGDAAGTSVSGLASQVNITGTEAANDRVVINAGNGDDVVAAADTLAATAIQLSANGEVGDDVLTGGDGNDILTGGEGDDVLIGGPGIDILDGGPGTNILIQE